MNNVAQTQVTKMISGDGSPDKQTFRTLTNGVETASHTQTQNSLGQVSSIYSKSGAHTSWVDNQLDVLGRMKQITDNYMGFSANYQYQKERLDKVQTNGSSTLNSDPSVNAQYSYYANNQIHRIVYPTLTDGNQLITTYTYNKALGWTESMENTKGSGSLSSYGYSYDNNGNRVSVSESRNGAAAQTTNYAYDALNRLISIGRPDGGQTTYTYDVRDNRLTLSDTNTVSLDSADTSYTYDLQNTLTSVTKSGASTSFKYYADGMRSMKTKGNTQTQVNYNFQGQVISEEKIVNGTFVEQANFVRGDRVLVKKDKKAAKDYYYLYNGHGDVVQIVDTNGTVVNNYAYDEWGNITSQEEKISNSFKYTGEVYDQETGLYYLRARYYDPSMGRFLNEDTVEGQIDNPLSMNLYTYVVNNPLLYSDPTGHAHTEIGVNYTDSDRATIAAYQNLFAMGQSLNDPYLMQSAHDGANLIRLKYQRTVSRTTYVDYYTGTPSKNKASLEYTSSMYSELYNGNASPVPTADVLMSTVGFIGGPGEIKVAYKITTEAVEAVMKQWGKTTGKKAMAAFEKSAAKGIVSSQRENGIKYISGIKKGGTTYTMEIKVLNKEFGDYRIYGYKDEAGNVIFNYFDKGLH